MAAPAFGTAGAGAAAAGDINVNYPASISAGDLLILQVGHEDETDYAPPSVTGFTNIYDDFTELTAGVNHWVYARKATGSESGSVTVPREAGASQLLIGRMYRFTGWNDTGTLTDAFEAPAWGTGTDASIEQPSITTLGVDRLCVALVWVGDDNPLDAFGGTTGGTWEEPVAEFTTTTGDDGALGIQTLEKAAAGTVSGGVDTMGLANDPWGVKVFALLPSGGAPAPNKRRYSLTLAGVG